MNHGKRWAEQNVLTKQSEEEHDRKENLSEKKKESLKVMLNLVTECRGIGRKRIKVI